MGVDISVGDPKSDNYVREKLGSYTSFLNWKYKIAEKIGIDLYYRKGPIPKFQLILGHSGGYKLEELSSLLEQLNEIKKLDIEEYDTIVGFDVSKKRLDYQGTLTIKSEDPVIDKFIRICKIAIKRQQSIDMS